MNILQVLNDITCFLTCNLICDAKLSSQSSSKEGDKQIKLNKQGKHPVFGTKLIDLNSPLPLQIFVLLFIFVKRQIMRFAMKSRRGPHVPLGHNAPKVRKNSFHFFVLFVC